MHAPPRITVEVPVLGIGSGLADYESLGHLVQALRRPQGLHLTLLHVGILDDLAHDIEAWTKGITPAEDAAGAIVRWLYSLPGLEGFDATSDRLIVLGGGRVAGLEVDVPQHVHHYQVSLVQGLRDMLDGLLVDKVDDFILGSPALGFRSPHWVPHVAVGRPPLRERGPWDIQPVTVACGPSRIRNSRFLPAAP
jgi:hypothetical protein